MLENEMSDKILEVKNLTVAFRTDSGEKFVVRDVNFSVKKGENVAIVGESGSGKSVTNLSILGLNDNANISGEILYYGEDLLKFSYKQLQSIRGNKIAMIFQDPMTSLNPFLKNVNQIMEPLLVHKGMSKRQAKERALELLDLVGIKDARKSLGKYPHHFSGGMRQRVMIAIALSCNPDLLIADEPTTALDVTVQAQILDLIQDLRIKLNMSVILVTHNLGIVAGMADRVLVMNQGRIVEQGNVDDIFYNTQHAYTKGLIRSIPRLDQDKNEPLYSMSSNEKHEEVLKGGRKASQGLFSQSFCRAFKNKKVIFGFVTFSVYIFMLFAPQFLPIYSYTDQNPVHRNLSPSIQTAGSILYQKEKRLLKKQAKRQKRKLTTREKQKLESIKRDIDEDSVSKRRYILGTDSLGRDMFARLIYASRISIFIGISGTLVSLCLGVVVGAISGYVGGRLDRFIMAAVEILYSLPSILLIVLMMTILGGSDIINLFVAISLLSWLVEARLVRGQILSLKNSEFIEAARSMGASTGNIIFKHLIPNMMDIIIVFATVRIPSFILAESFLSFLGLGISAPLASWGVLISDGVKSMELYPWQLFLPAFLMALFLFAINFFGDGLRDCFDLKEKSGQKIL